LYKLYIYFKKAYFILVQYCLKFVEALGIFMYIQCILI
jgi:hypothetical protein